MKKFAQILEHNEIGQVLIVRSQTLEDKPQVTVHFMIEDMKVGPEYQWENTEEGIDSRDKFWYQLQEDATYVDKYVVPIYQQIKTQVELAQSEGKNDGHDSE